MKQVKCPNCNIQYLQYVETKNITYLWCYNCHYTYDFDIKVTRYLGKVLLPPPGISTALDETIKEYVDKQREKRRRDI